MKPAQKSLRLVKDSPEPELPRDFDGLFRRFAPYVGAIGLRLLGNREEAEDLVQDVFIDAHRSLSSLRDQDAVKAWLATIAVRKAHRRLRRRRLFRWVGLAQEPDYEALTAQDAPQQHRVLLRQLYQILDGLSPEQRIAWVLRHIEGEKLTDVARLVGCSLATAKRRIGAADAVIEEALTDG